MQISTIRDYEIKSHFIINGRLHLKSSFLVLYIKIGFTYFKTHTQIFYCIRMEYYTLRFPINWHQYIFSFVPSYSLRPTIKVTLVVSTF